jgi:hypothetical protein
MGDIEQIEFMKSLAGGLRGPILEIGSKRYGGFPMFFDYRTLFPAATRYVGIDMEAGEGVDAVVDMTTSIDSIREKVGTERFQTIICLSVMEHVGDIVTFSRNVEALLAPGGTLVLSVPFVWEIHAYPYDYWRFTPRAIEFLYPSIAFDPATSRLHTDTGRVASLSDVGDDMNRFVKMIYKPAHKDKTLGKRLRIMTYSLVRRVFGLGKNPLYNTNIEMVGRKK